jgi:hypothetical protein
MWWSRGFFRLWIVLSVAWIGITVTTLGTDEFKGLWRPSVELDVEYKGDTKDVLDSSRPPGDLRRQIVDGVRRDAAQLQRTDPAEAKRQIEVANATADDLLKAMVDENQKRADRLRKALLFLLAPPAALLVLGIATAWIAGGFRRRKE